MNRVKHALLAASTSLALAITFTSCGGSKPPAMNDGFDDVSNITDELLKECHDKYKEHYCGVGEGVSTKAGSAGEIAQGIATANLILQMKQDVIRGAKGGDSVDPNDQAVSSALSKWSQHANESVSNVQVRDSKTQFNKQEGKYRVYRLVSVPKEDALKDLQRAVSSDQALKSTATAAAILESINNSIKNISGQ